MILGRGMKNTLWPEVVLAMTYVKNLQPTQAFEHSIILIEKEDNIFPNLKHFRIWGLTVIVLLYEEEHTLKSAKWDAKASKKKLVGFDGHTICRVYIEKQNKVIRVKDFRIFEDTRTKIHSILSDFNWKPIMESSY